MWLCWWIISFSRTESKFLFQFSAQYLQYFDSQPVDKILKIALIIPTRRKPWHVIWKCMRCLSSWQKTMKMYAMFIFMTKNHENVCDVYFHDKNPWKCMRCLCKLTESWKSMRPVSYGWISLIHIPPKKLFHNLICWYENSLLVSLLLVIWNLQEVSSTPD